jgi:hypothetical protein
MLDRMLLQLPIFKAQVQAQAGLVDRHSSDRSGIGLLPAIKQQRGRERGTGACCHPLQLAGSKGLQIACHILRLVPYTGLKPPADTIDGCDLLQLFSVIPLIWRQRARRCTAAHWPCLLGRIGLDC